MRGLRYIFILLFILCYRGLSAQEFDLYDFRYYKRFESAEELLTPEADTTIVSKFTLNRNFTTHNLDYNLSFVRFARRGKPHYYHKTFLNNLEVPFISSSSIRTLQLREERHTDRTNLLIDTLKESRTSSGFAFTSRNMPYSISLDTAQKLGKDWSLATNLIVQTGRDLHIEGIFGNSLEFNIIAAKNWSNKNTLSIAFLAKPSKRSTRIASTAEAFRLTGNNLYNPAWGYQNGKIRSSRIREKYLPTAFIGYESVINKRTKLSIAMALTAGIEKYSGLEWFNTQTPVPDNYRYMPSYFDDEEDIASAVELSWRTNDTHYTQIDFDRLIATNRLNGDEATYAISNRVRRTINTSLRVGANTSLNKGEIAYGIEASIANYRNFKQMHDLLGAKYIVDLDYFLLDDDTFGNYLQNNLATPNRRITEGERFGYDYAIRRYNISPFVTYHYSTERFNFDIAAKFGYCEISRRGFFRKELFAESSLGKSQSINISPYSARISADYIITDNHYIETIIATEATPCDDEDLFLQSQYNNRIIDSPALRNTYNAEVRYSFQKQNIALNTTLFISSELNNTQVYHIYDDLSGEYADIVTNNINTLCYGLEVEGEFRFANHFRSTVAITVGRYKYARNASVSIYTDTTNLLLADNIESHIKGLSLGNSPQIAVTAGLSYYNKGWWATINANYAGLRYIEPSPIMRTNRVLATAQSPEQHSALCKQERLRDAFTIDLSLSKSIYLSRLSKKIYRTSAAPRFEDKYPKSRFIFRLGIRNILGSSNIIYNAYESSRLQRYKLAGEYIYNRQASRYMYAYPRTFYASATFTF